MILAEEIKALEAVPIEDELDEEFVQLVASNVRKQWIEENGYPSDELQKSKLKTVINGDEDLERQIDEELKYEEKK